MKPSAIAAVTGKVAANTAIGRLEASMLDTATTSSITNRLKVPALSSVPTGLIKMNIQASPYIRSRTMKRTRHDRATTSAIGSSRNCRHLLTMMAWMTSTEAVQAPAASALVHRLDRKPTVATSSRITSDADCRFCAYCRSNS